MDPNDVNESSDEEVEVHESPPQVDSAKVENVPPLTAEQKEQLPGGDARTWGSWDRVVLQDGMIVRDAMIPSIKVLFIYFIGLYD